VVGSRPTSDVLPPTSWVATVGHSNRSLADFVAILGAHGVRRVIDVRRFPASRKWPHFNAAELARGLAEAGIEYAGMPELGGRRRARPDSPHTAWRVEAFRGYADFMDTPGFSESIEKAETLAREAPSALMCAEALVWRCHRSLLADSFVARGWEVSDILSEKEARPHKLPAFARLEGNRVIYDKA
jgi:uncharacterized protein (DUF488 family)